MMAEDKRKSEVLAKLQCSTEYPCHVVPLSTGNVKKCAHFLR
jgi:hypothetical protein